MSEPVIYTSRTIESVKSLDVLQQEYIAVMQRLHGADIQITSEQLRTLLDDPKEIVTFVLIDGVIVATAQASFHYRVPYFEGYINNVVTHPDYGGRGLGRLVMESLEQAAKDEWGENGSRPLHMILSNSPSKGNGGFYKKLGWTSRGPEGPSPTVMWVKTI